MSNNCKRRDFDAELVIPVDNVRYLISGGWPLFRGHYNYMRCDNCGEEFDSEQEAIAHYEASE